MALIRCKDAPPAPLLYSAVIEVSEVMFLRCTVMMAPFDVSRACKMVADGARC